MHETGSTKRTFLTLLSIVPILLLFLTDLGAEARRVPIGELLPVGLFEAEVLEAKMSERADELSRRLSAAMAEKQDWFKQYITDNAKPGKPLPYHPNFGLSKAEYKELLHAREERQLTVSNTIMLQVENKENSYLLSTDGKYPLLDGAVIRADNLNVLTRVGILKDPEWTKKLDSPLGPWQGYSWKLEEGSVMQGKIKSVSFSLGRLEKGKIILDYRVLVMDNGKVLKKTSLSLRFNAPTAEKLD